MPRFMLPLIAGVFASSASAAIVSVSGDATLIAAPPSVDSGVLVSTTTAFAFNERAGVLFSGHVDIFHPIPGFHYDITNAPGGGFSNQVVDSHMIHFDVTGINVDTQLTGSVTFDQPVYAVMISNTNLDLSDADLGAPGTLYPLGVSNRGFSGTPDWVRLIAPDTLQFAVRNSNTADQIRVLTLSVPAPASGGVLALGALAGVRRRR